MNRRNAIKNISLSLGYVVATPTIMSLLSSCTETKEIWKPEYLSDEQKNIITHLVDLILPTSDLPGALDVNVPQFIDKMYMYIENEANKNVFQKGATIFAAMFEELFDEKALRGNKKGFDKLFASYFKLPEEEIRKVMQEQKLAQHEVSNDRKATYLMYKFLFRVRYYTLFGYYTSEKIGEEVLSYDPIPGVYKGCIPLDNVGNSWSL